MKHKNMHAYLFFASAIVAGSSSWAMEPVIETVDEGPPGNIMNQGKGKSSGLGGQVIILGGTEPSQSVEDQLRLRKEAAKQDREDSKEDAAAVVEAVLAQAKATAENKDELKQGIDNKTELQVYAELARKREIGKQDPWHAERDFATQTVKTFALQTAAHGGKKVAERTVDALYDRFDPVAQAQKRVATTQAEQGEMVSISAATQLKMQQYTDEEYLEIVLINNPKVAQRYEKYTFSTPEELQNELIKNLHPDFSAKKSEEQSTIKELAAQQIEKEKQEINRTIDLLIKRQKRADTLQRVRNKMAVNQRIQEVHDTITRQAS